VSPPDALSPDQRAVLQLLLKQGKRYDELAALLRIESGAVRQRAVSALDALSPSLADVSAGRRGELADWLLGQQDPAESRQTVEYLAGSPAARTWARGLSDELRAAGLGSDRLPSVPEEPVAAARVAEAEAGPTAGAEPAPGPDDEPVAEQRLPGFAPTTPTAGSRQPASRLGGALLLAGIVIVLAVALVWALTSGGDDKSGSAATTAAQTQTQPATTSTTAEQPTIAGQVNLRAPGGGKALGVANVLAQGDQRAIAIQAQDLQPNTKRDAYAVWLTEGPNDSATRLGFAPAVGKDGRLEGATGLPENASRYKRLVISRETSSDPKRPGTVVLSGSIRVR
jgi:hypothetical protein